MTNQETSLCSKLEPVEFGEYSSVPSAQAKERARTAELREHFDA